MINQHLHLDNLEERRRLSFALAMRHDSPMVLANFCRRLERAMGALWTERVVSALANIKVRDAVMVAIPRALQRKAPIMDQASSRCE
jgi:hypothetical protein